MYTQCPHCGTLFRIRVEQLKARGGQARCCRCHEVFNALDHLSGAPAKPPGRVAEVVAPFNAAARPSTEDPNIGPADDVTAGSGDAGEPVQPMAGMGDEEESRLEPPFEDPGANEADAYGPLPGETGDEADDDSDPPFTMPDDLPEIEPAGEEDLEAGEVQDRPRSVWSTLGWTLGVLGLLALALGQLLWWERDVLAQHPQGRRLVEPFCEALGCQIPPRRAPERIRVLSRDVSPHPGERDALLILLVMANEASFAQPFPMLQLTLYDEKERAVGRRRFMPKEYLEPETPRPMQPDRAVYVRLELVDPGEQVTGFRFEFL